MMNLWWFLLQLLLMLADGPHMWESWIEPDSNFLSLLFSSFFSELSLLTSHQKANMLVLLAGIFVVHIATVVMLFVSTIANVSNVLSSIHSTRSCLNIYITRYKRNLSCHPCPSWSCSLFMEKKKHIHSHFKQWNNRRRKASVCRSNLARAVGV